MIPAQSAGDGQNWAPIWASGHEREEELDLLGALLHVAEVVENDDVKGIQASERVGQSQVALGGE